jgi:methyl-accepting chemotaxis protein PixJ
LRAKAVAIAIAISMLPVLGIGATVYYFANRSISEQSTQTKQTRASDPTDIASVPQTQMPLTLAIETAVAVLLLVGLIAAFFANRAMRPTPISDATNEELITKT